MNRHTGCFTSVSAELIQEQIHLQERVLRTPSLTELLASSLSSCVAIREESSSFSNQVMISAKSHRVFVFCLFKVHLVPLKQTSGNRKHGVFR